MADRGEQLWAFATAISRSAPVLLGRFDQAGAVEKAKAELCTADPSTRTWAAAVVTSSACCCGAGVALWGWL